MLHWWQSGADPGDHAVLCQRPHAAGGTEHQLLRRRRADQAALRVGSNGRPGEARQLLSDAQRRIAELVPELVLYNTSKIDAVPATLENFKGNPTNAGPFWNVHEWRFP